METATTSLKGTPEPFSWHWERTCTLLAEASLTVSHQEPGTARGWLPTLDAEHRFRSTTETIDQSDDSRESSSSEFASPSETKPERIVSQDWSAALESQFGLRTGEQHSAKVNESDEQVVMRERLAYYEHFDALIKDNISRSAELFQAVFTEREKARAIATDAEAIMNAVSAESERRASAERLHMTHILMSLMDEATFLQQRSDALVQRVAEAITEMTAFRDEDDEPVSGA